MGESYVLVLFVDTMTNMAERQGRALAELTELGLAFARGLEARVQLVQSVDEAQVLALAFHRISRSVRLCLALELRLQRERLQGAREDRAEVRHAVERRKSQVRTALTRDIYDESEAGDVEALLDELDERLDEEAIFDAFAEGPVEACIARIRKDLGLPPAPPANDPGIPPLTRASPFPLEGGRAGDGGGAASARATSGMTRAGGP